MVHDARPATRGRGADRRGGIQPARCRLRRSAPSRRAPGDAQGRGRADRVQRLVGHRVRGLPRHGQPGAGAGVPASRRRRDPRGAPGRVACGARRAALGARDGGGQAAGGPGRSVDGEVRVLRAGVDRAARDRRHARHGRGRPRLREQVVRRAERPCRAELRPRWPGGRRAARRPGPAAAGVAGGCPLGGRGVLRDRHRRGGALVRHRAGAR